MEVKTTLCVLVAIIALASGFPAWNQNGGWFNRGGRQGQRPPFGSRFGNGRRGPPPSVMRVLMMCGREMSWPELRDKDCSPFMNDITPRIEQLYTGHENEFFQWKLSIIRQNRNNANVEPPCDKIMCFKRTLMQRILSEGLPTFCDGCTEDAPDMPNGGLASLINPANRDDLIDMMKDGFCFGMDKLSYIIQVKIVQNQLGLPDHGMPVRAAMMHRIRQHAADCESFDESNVDCTDLDPDSYVDAMYGSDEQWDAAVEQKKAILMGNRRNGPMQPGVMRTRMCRAKKCFGDALDRAMQQRNGQMPLGCRALYQRRSEIFRQVGPPPSNDKIKLMTCLRAFKASMQYRIDQDSLQCDGTTAAVLNDLFSESPSVVDSAVERIRTAWTQVEDSETEPPQNIPDEKVCKFKAIRDKLEQENRLPSFCEDEIKFDQDQTSASAQDVKEMICFKMKKLNEHMFS